MTARKKKAPPALPEEAVTDAAVVDAIGCPVKVRGLLLNERLELALQEGTRMEGVARMLAVAVVDDEGLPIYTSHEWERFGAVHFGIAMDLWNKASKMSGLLASKDEGAPKN